MIYNQELARQVETYVSGLYHTYQTAVLVYHNLEHTKHVIKKMDEIASNYTLDAKARFILESATWFHDCGHLFGPAANHEIKSATVMRSHLEGRGVEEGIIHQVQHCILSTKIPNHPETLLGEILCDADLYHLGTTAFADTDELVKKELELRNNSVPSDWDERTLSFLERHSYFTSYCRVLLEQGKQNNIAILVNKINNRPGAPDS